ncbi:TIGR03564 family F420-dependent LLM class oxidoreductase [Rhodococcus sp. NPDC047139]|uniref:TIGR03564 family F420-dependent LLM class oxidoreductase n=1 Tax=Rhodococcus sp. NPDC047139 TaxID=3155141 RepID=UPI0033F6B706
MRIGLTGGASSTDRIVRQARKAEADGFTSLWFASTVAGDPLAALAVAGRETASIELGTAVLQTFPCHPLLQANRAAAVAEAMGRPGFTLGLGPSHESVIREVYGLSYDTPGRNTEEYIRIVTALLHGEDVDFRGGAWSVRSEGRMVAAAHEVPVLLSAMSPRMLRVAGRYADGTVLWMASPKVIESRISPAIRAAAERSGRPEPRIVAGLPVAVHDDVDAAREAVAATATSYAGMPSYRRVLEEGGASSPADIAIVGDEESVRRQLQGLLDAGATDIWAAIVPVDDEPRASIHRTRALLSALTAE